MNAQPQKPLGSKAYGSIPHLPGSRLGPGDWSLNEGQARILLEKPRRGDRIIVTEKLDGACMAVANVDGAIVPLTRSGYRAGSGTFEHLRAFEKYVAQNYDHFAAILGPGERLVGEWLALAHATRYDTNHPAFAPFIAFDLMSGKERMFRAELLARCSDRIPTAHCIHDSAEPLSVERALEELGLFGCHGAIDPIEGAVWRVEREGRVDFLAKFVRHDKVDGLYLSEISGNPPVWNLPEYREAA